MVMYDPWVLGFAFLLGVTIFSKFDPLQGRELSGLPSFLWGGAGGGGS
jgi:hypothetical protein